MAAFAHQLLKRSCSRDDETYPPHAGQDAIGVLVLLRAGPGPSRQGSALLRENDAIALIIVCEELPAKPGEPKGLRASRFWRSDNHTNKGHDDECNDDQGRLGAASRPTHEVETKSAWVRAVRIAAAAGRSGQGGERARALRVRGEERGARVVDVVTLDAATGNFAGCARPA